MLYEIDKGRISRTCLEEAKPDRGLGYIGFFKYDEARAALQRFEYKECLVEESIKPGPMMFENREGYDFMRIHIPPPKMGPEHDNIVIYLGKNAILFICDKEAILQRIYHTITNGENAGLIFDRFLYAFFEKLTVYDVAFLDKLEQEISNLESALIESQKRNFVKEIISLRKRLMPLKRHYEQLLNLLDELQENENGMLDDSVLRYFRIFSSKAERHYHSILNLRDYVTQVREAYQSKVDIDLNSVMKIFTVITAIFLPLNLIVGWYGMNLKMPEFSWPYAYPMVFAISISAAAFSIAYFKKKKWF